MMAGKESSTRAYWIVFGILMLLLAATAVGDRIEMGSGNLIFAIGVAATKAVLIALFFMHLRDAFPVVRLVAAASLLWMAIALALTMADYAARGWHEPRQGWLAEEQIPETYDSLGERR